MSFPSVAYVSNMETARTYRQQVIRCNDLKRCRFEKKVLARLRHQETRAMLRLQFVMTDLW